MSKCLYLVSSSASREYVSDCVEALALPRGAVMHFRYLKGYVDEQVWNALSIEGTDLPSILRQMSTVVVFLFQTQKGGRWTPSEKSFLPLRKGTLLSAFRDGEVAHFYFAVTDYIEIENNPRKVLTERVGFKREDTKPSYAHLGEALEIAANAEEDSRAFQRFVMKAIEPREWRTRSLGSAPLDVTYDIIFYRIVGLFDISSDTPTLISPNPRRVGGTLSTEYRIAPGRRYALKITTQIPQRAPADLPGGGEAVLRLAVDPRKVELLSTNEIPITSTYDLSYWPFALAQSADGFLSLKVYCSTPPLPRSREFLRREMLCPETTLGIFISTGEAVNAR